MKTRLLEIIKQKNLSPARFADEIGVQRSSISHILNGRNNPSIDFIQKILTKYPEINAEWLLTGKGNPFNSNFKPNEIAISNTLIKKKLNDCLQNELEYHTDSPKPLSDKRNIVKIVIFYSDNSYEEFFKNA